MKPHVSSTKDYRGRINGYEASIGSLIASGSTAAEARTVFDDVARAALERLTQGTHIGRELSCRYAVYPTIDGWSYWLESFSDDRYRSSCRSGGTRGDAINAALSHLAQNAWTPDVTDDFAFVELPWHRPGDASRLELLSWIKWQRRYAVAIAAGLDDAAARQAAGSVA